MQRAPMSTPTLSVPAGSYILPHAGTSQTANFTLVHVPSHHAPNGVSVVGQSHSYNQAAHMPNVSNPAYRHPPPPSHFAGSYPPTEMIMQQYAVGPYLAQGYGYQQYPQFTTAIYANGGPAYGYPGTSGFTGPSAMEIQIPPAIAPPPQQQPPPPQQPQPQPPPPPVSIPAASNVGQASGAGQVMQPQQQAQGQQRQPPRQKKILKIVDPTTGEDKMEDLQKEQQRRGSVTYGGLWKPSVEQQQQQPPAALPTSGTFFVPGSAQSTEVPPSRSSSSTPRLEEPKMQESSVKPPSRGPSPAMDPAQQKDRLSEFYTQFTNQLAQSDETDQPGQLYKQDDTAIMPPPTSIPPRSRKSSGHSAAIRVTPPPTPPPVTVPVKSLSKAPVEFGIGPSMPPSRKPKEIIGESVIQFGWLDTSSGDRSMEAAEVETGDSAVVPQMQVIVPLTPEDGGVVTATHFPSPQRQRPEPTDILQSSTPILSMDMVPPRQNVLSIVDPTTGCQDDAVPQSPREYATSRHDGKSQSFAGGLSQYDKSGQSQMGLVSSASVLMPVAVSRNSSGNLANTFTPDASTDQNSSMEERSVDQNGAAPMPASMTSDDKTAVLAAIEIVKKLEETSGGERRYCHEFMLAASNLPSSKTRPEFITDTWTPECVDEVFNLNRRLSQINLDAMRGRQLQPMPAGFAPVWMQGPAMDMSGRKPYPGRLSDSVGVRGGAGGKGGSRHGPPSLGGRGGPTGNKQPPLIIARPSMDVELKSSSNAWKPAHKRDTTDDPEIEESKKLMKEVRGILNKITPQTFEELSGEFLELEPKMNTEERASAVVDVVFQKAVDEPAFCTVYGELYEKVIRHQLNKQQQLQQQLQKAQEAGQDATKESITAQPRETTFRWILLTKCQREFEKDKRCEASVQDKKGDIEQAETAEQKKQLQDELNEFLSKEKRRTLGNMRFIGELFLRSLLTSKIMHRCVMELLGKTNDEESIECLCKLLTTIGKKLEAEDRRESQFQGQNDGYYTRLEEISRGLSSRIRFMIMDLLELRASAWQPRRKGEGPKTLQQLHEDAAKEKIKKQEELLAEERKNQELAAQDRRGGGGNRRGDMHNRSSDQDGRRGMAERSRDQQSRQSGRQGAGAASQQQVLQPSADLSKAKAPNLSQHLGTTDGEVKLGPQRWARPAPPAGSSASTSRQVPMTQTKRSNQIELSKGVINEREIEIDRLVKEGDINGLIEYVETSGCLSGEDSSLKTLSALVKSLFVKVIVDGESEDSVDVDLESFERDVLKVLLRFVTSKPQYEMKTLDALGDLSEKKGSPKGLLVKMFSTLKDGGVIPVETFREWWQSNKKSLPGMISSSGEVKAFFSQFTADAPSDMGSDSDQCE